MTTPDQAKPSILLVDDDEVFRNRLARAFDDRGYEVRLVDLDFDRATTFHLTLGAGLNLKIVNLSAAYSFAEHNSFNLGVSLGTLGL